MDWNRNCFRKKLRIMEWSLLTWVVAIWNAKWKGRLASFSACIKANFKNLLFSPTIIFNRLLQNHSPALQHYFSELCAAVPRPKSEISLEKSGSEIFRLAGKLGCLPCDLGIKHQEQNCFLTRNEKLNDADKEFIVFKYWSSFSVMFGPPVLFGRAFINSA